MLQTKSNVAKSASQSEETYQVVNYGVVSEVQDQQYLASVVIRSCCEHLLAF